MAKNDLKTFIQSLQNFSMERDWEKFHSPKNLSMALNCEAGELIEHFQWLTEEQSRNLDPAKTRAIAMEMADVFIYLLLLADQLQIDLIQAATQKMVLNAAKYPAEKVRGSAKKYSEYDDL